MQKLGLTDLKVNKLWVHALYVGDEELTLLNPAFDHGTLSIGTNAVGFPAHQCVAKPRLLLLGTDSLLQRLHQCSSGTSVFSAADFMPSQWVKHYSSERARL